VPARGSPLPASIQSYNGAPANGGTSTTPYDSTYTTENADKHYQLNQDFAFYKGGWWVPTTSSSAISSTIW